MRSRMLLLGGTERVAPALCRFGRRGIPWPEFEPESILELEVLSSWESFPAARFRTLPEGGTGIGVGGPCAMGLDAVGAPLSILLAALRMLAKERSERRGMKDMRVGSADDCDAD
jgi:hypothetical protein